jgi:ADP-ribose pyrophosphatase
MPLGLIDEGETAEQAAVRELEEETGYKADRVIESSPLIVSDPGLHPRRNDFLSSLTNGYSLTGMTNANMKLVAVSVVLADKLEVPDQRLDSGEFIVRRVIELANLSRELKAYSEMVGPRLLQVTTEF